MKKNEDTFSIQIMDEKEKLHMLLKKDLKEIQSPAQIADAGDRFDRRQLDNVIAFLKNPAGRRSRRRSGNRAPIST